MPYPTGSDLSTYLIATGQITAAPASLLYYNDVMSAVALDWEKDTGWVPFLAGASASRTFDGGEGYRLFLPVGIISLSALTIDGSAYTVDTDFYLAHQFKGGPYMAVDFPFYVGGDRRAIVITGVFGYQTTLDKAVERALLMRGGREIIDSQFSTGELKKETVGPVSYEYDVSTARDRMTSVYDDAVKRYKRWA